VYDPVSRTPRSRESAILNLERRCRSKPPTITRNVRMYVFNVKTRFDEAEARARLAIRSLYFSPSPGTLHATRASQVRVSPGLSRKFIKCTSQRWKAGESKIQRANIALRSKVERVAREARSGCDFLPAASLRGLGRFGVANTVM